MPIDKPDSGTVITPETIKEMHEQVRNSVNKVPVTSLGRGTFNMRQLPSLISRTASTISDDSPYGDLAYGFTEVTENCYVKYVSEQFSGPDFYFADFEPHIWDEIKAEDGSTPYRISSLADSGGWRLKKDDVVFAFLSCRVNEVDSAFVDHGGAQVWLGLHKTALTGHSIFLATDDLDPPYQESVDIGCIRLGDDIASYDQGLEQTITIASAFSASTLGITTDKWSLVRLSAHGVLIKADHGSDDPSDYLAEGTTALIDNGTMGAFVLRTNGLQT